MNLIVLNCLFSLFVLTNAVQFHVLQSARADNSFAMDEGDQTVVLIISGLVTEFKLGCAHTKGWCSINEKKNITVSSCTMDNVENKSKKVEIKLQTFKVTQAHAGLWSCYYFLHQTDQTSEKKADLVNHIKITVTIKKQNVTETLNWTIAIISGVIVLVLIIIGQTLCILYFKSKARKAEINKNLTPKNSMDQNSLEMRYVKKTSASDEIVRESGIYEALDTDRAHAPPLPPIETLPVTPKPFHLAPSKSQSNLSRTLDSRHIRTTPRPQTKNPQNQRKFNTIDRSTSLEQIMNRPQLALPTEEAIYEDVTLLCHELPRANQYNNSEEKTQLLARKPKKSLFGKDGPKRPPFNEQEPNSPALGQKPPIGPPGIRLPLPGQFLPGTNHRSPIGATGKHQPPKGAFPVKGALPVLPSMITAANLKPVKTLTRPPGPVQEAPRMTPAHSFTHLASKLKPAPPRKPKPPMPAPVLTTPEPVPFEPEYPPTYYDSSSDEEFDCYDVLPEYRIYANAPPKKYK